MSNCPFRILGLPKTASQDEVLRQWRKLLLEHHPDKNPGKDTTEIATGLNDAKQRALERCAERDHSTLEKEAVTAHVERLRVLIKRQLSSLNCDELNQQIKQMVAQCRTQVRFVINSNPELGAYRALVSKLDAKIEKLNTRIKEKNDQIKALEVRIREETDAKHKSEEQEAQRRMEINALKVKLIEVERLAKEPAIAEANTLAAQAKAELAAAKAQWDSEREAMHAQITNCKQQPHTADAHEDKKRKHQKMLTAEEETHFKKHPHALLLLVSSQE